MQIKGKICRFLKKEEEKKVDFFWAETMWMHEQFDNIYFAEHVKVNHFPRFYELTRKNLLAKNLKRFQKMMGKFCLLETFLLYFCSRPSFKNLTSEITKYFNSTTVKSITPVS